MCICSQYYSTVAPYHNTKQSFSSHYVVARLVEAAVRSLREYLKKKKKKTAATVNVSRGGGVCVWGGGILTVPESRYQAEHAQSEGYRLNVPRLGTD